jgi:hypothetical protein
MLPSPVALPSLSVSPDRASRSRRREDLIYQAMTVAAMVSMLASFWIF